jgi:large subunit ribosomal protein L13
LKTWNAKKEERDPKWVLVDAANQNLGRLSTRIATILRGKHLPTFTPHVDTGDFVVVINADKVTLTGRKWLEKTYYRRSRYFGSVKETSAEEMLAKDPTFIVTESVQGMLPKTKLGRKLINKLKVYAGPEHPHQAQKPEALTLEKR